MFRNIIGGLFFFFCLFFSTFFGSIFMMGPTLPLLFFKPNWFRCANDKLMGTWLGLPAALLEILFGMNVFITTEDFPSNVRRNEKVVIMMNHRTRLDWLCFWSVLFRQGKLENEKIILKNGLKRIPGPGWAMQVAMFMFLQRQWDKDKLYLNQMLRYFADINYPLQLLIFPEGTDLDTHSIQKSKSYALKNKLPIYKHVLHPRLRGFTYCVEQLRTHHSIDAIYDVTIGYRGNLCQSEFELAKGNFPQDVHFHIKRYPINSIPESTEQLEKWCTQKWAEKEVRLDRFYKDGKFVPESEERSVIVDRSGVRYQMIFWIVYWLTFICVVPVLMYHFWWVRWYSAIVFGIFLLQSVYGDGFEMLQLKRHALMTNYGDNENSYPDFLHKGHSIQNSNGKKHAT